MFDIGFSELFLIAIVALIVLGPERLPRAAKFTGLWIRRARAQWYSVKSELERELADDELKRSLERARADLQDVQAELRESGQGLRRELEEGRDLARSAVASAERAAAAPPAAASDPGIPPAGTAGPDTGSPPADGPVRESTAPQTPARVTDAPPVPAVGTDTSIPAPASSPRPAATDHDRR